MIGQTITVYKGVITSKVGPAQGDPATIMYTAIAVMTDDVVTVTPAQIPANRMWRAPEIIAALVDSPCTIQVIGSTVKLYDVQEGIPFEVCTPTP